MKVKIEYVILALVIVALGLYLFFRTTDRTSYTLPDLPALKAQDVTKIEIGRGDKTIQLVRQNDGWRVSPGDYPADAGLVKRMLDDLTSLKVTALVSETRNYAHYDLDEANQIRVTAYQDGKVLRTFQIGKAAETMRHTHIVLAGDANVYHAQGNFRNDFDKSVADLRDKAVMAFDRDSVTEFTIETAGRKVMVHKAPPPNPSGGEGASAPDSKEPPAAPAWQTADGQTLDTKKVEGLLADLSDLKCRAYLDRSKNEFTTPVYRVRIQTGATSASLLEIFAAADDKATEVPARSSLREDPFTLSDFDVDPIKDFLADLNGSKTESGAAAGGRASSP
jgi:hypothetical protein